MENKDNQSNNPTLHAELENSDHQRKRWRLPCKKALIITALITTFTVALTVAIVLTKANSSHKNNAQSSNSAESQNPTTQASNAQPIDESQPHTHTPVDVTKLPLGDNKYSSSPKLGYVYSCQSSFNGGGAFAYGPWIDQANKTWNANQKVNVDGDVSWSAAYWDSSSSGDSRTIKSADLPYGHNTGTYPVSSKDVAYNYDRNPNSIKQQTITFSVPKNPTTLSSPQCVGGEVGIATTGVLIFNAFDAGGRDAVAVEVQDKCDGHPQEGGYYHYHGYSTCFKDQSKDGEHSDLLGYAFDGFGLYGLKDEDGVELSSSDLDECHGHTHTISWDGQQVEMYHYHMTRDFPYTVSCFRGKASVNQLSAGGRSGGGQENQNGQNTQQGQQSAQLQQPPTQQKPPQMTQMPPPPRN